MLARSRGIHKFEAAGVAAVVEADELKEKKAVLLPERAWLRF
mgnify:CR=1 FL=1